MVLRDPVVVAALLAAIATVVGAAVTPLVTHWLQARRQPHLTAVPSTESLAFWVRDQFGLMHVAAGELGTSKPEMAIIFVHGIMSSPRVWGHLPRWILDDISCDVDILAFSYPSWPWQRSSVSRASQDLRTAIVNHFPNRIPSTPHATTIDKGYRHLIFVTHSTGGLVVKNLIRADGAGGLAALARGKTLFDQRESIAQRTRHVFNFAVPHQGASVILSLLQVPHYLLQLLLLPLLLFLRLLTLGKLDLGCNWMFAQLVYHNSWLSKLSTDYRDLELGFLEASLPFPVTHEITAAADVVITGAPGDTPQAALFRGHHTGLTKPLARHDTVVRTLCRIIRRFARLPECLVAQRTIARSYNIEARAEYSVPDDNYTSPWTTTTLPHP